MAWESKKIGTATFHAIFVKLPYKQRPKFYKGRATTPKETKENEKAIGLAFVRQVSNETDFDFKGFEGEVHANIEIQRPINKSDPKYYVGKADTKKPDVDNVLKLILDGLNGTAYKDDKQVTEAHIKKLPLCGRRDYVSIVLKFTYYKEVRV